MLSKHFLHCEKGLSTMRLFLILLAVPLIEIALFVQIGGAIGLLWTLILVVGTAAAGTILLRGEGLRVLARIRSSAGRGQDIGLSLLHGLFIFASGLLLLTPGFFTDAAGIALLFPSVRTRVIEWGGRNLATQVMTSSWARRSSGKFDDDTIEGTAHTVDDSDRSG